MNFIYHRQTRKQNHWGSYGTSFVTTTRTRPRIHHTRLECRQCGYCYDGAAYAAHTEGRVTLVDAYLAGAVLVLNALFGWWWADPLTSLIIVYYGIREAIHALHESSEPMNILRKDQ